MSMIDCFKHEVIGFCKNGVALYRLKQDVPDDPTEFDGKEGDLLLGGGSGESSAFRISIAKAIEFLTRKENPITGDTQYFHETYRSFWSMTDGYIFGCEYREMGWDPDEIPLETWLVEHVIAFVLESYPDDYSQYVGEDRLDQDGSIFRLPIFEKLQGWC